VQKVILDSIAAGVPRKFAAMRAGIDESTFHFWVRKGKRAKRGPHFQFFQSVKKAEADAIARNVAIVQKAAAKTWQAAAWWLERRHPDEFARREPVERQRGKQSSGTPADQITGLLGLLAAYEAAARASTTGTERTGSPGPDASGVDPASGTAGPGISQPGG
jgi:hypothetical protein